MKEDDESPERTNRDEGALLLLGLAAGAVWLLTRAGSSGAGGLIVSSGAPGLIPPGVVIRTRRAGDPAFVVDRSGQLRALATESAAAYFHGASSFIVPDLVVRAMGLPGPPATASGPVRYDVRELPGITVPATPANAPVGYRVPADASLAAIAERLYADAALAPGLFAANVAGLSPDASAWLGMSGASAPLAKAPSWEAPEAAFRHARPVVAGTYLSVPSKQLAERITTNLSTSGVGVLA